MMSTSLEQMTILSLCMLINVEFKCPFHIRNQSQYLCSIILTMLTDVSLKFRSISSGIKTTSQYNVR